MLRHTQTLSVTCRWHTLPLPYMTITGFQTTRTSPHSQWKSAPGLISRVGGDFAQWPAWESRMIRLFLCVGLKYWKWQEMKSMTIYFALSLEFFLHLPFLSVQDWLTWNNAEIDYFWLVTLKSFSTMIIICTCRIICTLVRTQYPQDYVLWSQVWEFLRRWQFLEWISTRRRNVMDKLFKTRKRDLSSLCTPRSPSIAQLRLAVWIQHQNLV